MPSRNHAANNTIHASRMNSAYGSISAIRVPMPALVSYRRAIVTMNGKYTISGVSTFVGESPTRYAASTVWGATSRRAKIGMNTGAKIAHFGITPGRIKSSTAITRIIRISSTSAGTSTRSSTWAISTAITRGRLV